MKSDLTGGKGDRVQPIASFGDRVAQAVDRLGPLCAGIDPSAAVLGAWGLRDDVEGLGLFCRICVDAFAGVVPVIKPQVAFFERHGSAGMAELERLLADAAGASLIPVVGTHWSVEIGRAHV